MQSTTDTPTTLSHSPQPVTAEDVRGTVFRVVLRGYAPGEVDTFLDRVEATLRSRAGDASTGSPATDGTGRALSAPAVAETEADDEDEDASTRGLRLLQIAERTAEQLVAEARAEADRLVQAGHAEAEELRAGASAEAEALRVEAQERSAREALELERRVRDLQDQVAGLERLEHRHRGQMVTLLTEQLEVVRQREPLRAVRAVTS